MEKVKLPKEGVLFKPDYSKKLEYSKTYSRIRFTIWNLTNRLGIRRSYSKEPKDHLLLVDNFLHYIEKEQYIV
jgi:hypothetical protein